MDNIIAVPIGKRRWKFAEFRKDNERLHYGRFFLAPLLEGQGEQIGLSLRRILLQELEVTSIAWVKFLDFPWEYSNIPGVEESMHDIVMNCKNIVLRNKGKRTGIFKAVARGNGAYGPLTAKDIYCDNADIQVVDGTQHIATFTKNVSLSIDLEIETKRVSVSDKKKCVPMKESCYHINNPVLPVLNASYTIHPYTHLNEKREILILEIWTNGSLSPFEAFSKACAILVELVSAPLYTDDKELSYEEKRFVYIWNSTLEKKWELFRKTKIELSYKSILIEEFSFSHKVYNGLKEAGILTALDLVQKDYDRIRIIPLFVIEDLRELISTVIDYFNPS
jgi:DNA-directed RNA polymerase subunit alpha